MVARLPEHENIMSPRICEMARDPGGDGAGIGGDDRVVGEQLVQLVGDDLRLHRRVLPRAALLHQLVPLLHALLGLLQERAVLALLEQRQQRVERPSPASPTSPTSTG